jgi:hypothetical protein
MLAFVRKARRKGARVYIAGAEQRVLKALITHGVRPPAVRFKADIDAAVASAQRREQRVPDASGSEQGADVHV